MPGEQLWRDLLRFLRRANLGPHSSPERVKSQMNRRISDNRMPCNVKVYSLPVVEGAVFVNLDFKFVDTVDDWEKVHEDAGHTEHEVYRIA